MVGPRGKGPRKRGHAIAPALLLASLLAVSALVALGPGSRGPAAPTALSLGPAGNPALVPALVPLSTHAASHPTTGTGGPGPVEWVPLTNFSRLTPTPREGAAFVFDPASNAAILFGGTGCAFCGAPQNDTWSYAGGAWTPVNSTVVPPASEGPSAAYDPAVGAPILLTGPQPGSEPNVTSATWEFVGGSWTYLSHAGSTVPTMYASMAYDPQISSLLRFGGATPWHYYSNNMLNFSNATWLFENGAWVNITHGPAPPASFGGSAAYDPDLGGVVLFGGGNSNPTNSTWLFAGGQWSQLAPSRSPPAMLGATAAWDPKLDGIVLNGGSTYGDLYEWPAPGANRTWLFHNGTWSSLHTPEAMPVVAMGSAVYDPALGGTLLFGGTGWANESNAVRNWYFGSPNATWEVAPTPAVLLQSSPGPYEVGLPVAFQDPLARFIPSETIFWSFGDGHVSGENSPSHTFDTPGTFVVNLTASAAVGSGTSTDQASITVRVEPALAVRLSAVGSFTDPGRAIPLTATLSGGLPPVSVGWSFGDGTFANGSLVERHAFVSAGTYSVTAHATDSRGVARTASFVVHVEPFAQAAVGVASTVYDLGQTVALSTQTVNGSGPLVFAYEGLPAGCLSSDARNLTCVPTVTGAYAIDVLVTDVDGVTVVSPIQTLEIFPPLSGSVHTSATVLDQGQSFSLDATFDSQGSGNLTLVLPAELGCQPSGLFQAICTPPTTGTFPIGAVATDRAGSVDPLSALSVTVNPRFGVNAVGPTAAIPRASSYGLSLQPVGGSPPFHYAYSSLPDGCVSVNSSTFRCYASLAGEYAFGATVVDASGASARAHLVVYITDGAPAGAAPPTGGTPPTLPGGIVFWLVVAAAVIEIVLSLRYARRPRRRRGPAVRKGLWSDFGSARLDASDADGVPGTDAPS